MPSSHRPDTILACVYDAHVGVVWVSRVAYCAHGRDNLISEGVAR